MRWMIQGATIITLDDRERVFDTGDLVIEEDRIVAVGSHLSPRDLGVDNIRDGRGRLVIPGLVNAHLHSNDRFDKGRFDNLPLEVWGVLYSPPLGKRDWTPEECYLRTALNCLEMVKTGTTTVIDDVRHGAPGTRENIDAVFRAYRDSGMRALVGIGYSDLPFYKTIPYLEDLLPAGLKRELDAAPCSPEQVIALWRSYADQWRGRVGFVICPSAPQRCTEEFLERIRLLSEESDLQVVIHVLETRIQKKAGALFYGESVVAHMKTLNLLNSRTTLIHAVWVSDDDLRLIRDSGACIVHNPVANLKLGSGIAPLRRIIDAGIPVGLGTDNNNANDTANLFETMKMAALLHKVADPDYDRWPGARDVVRMATRGGAACGRVKDAGMLAPGMKADLVILDLNRMPFIPRNNLIHQLVFCEHGESVEMVVVDGKPVVEGGKVVTLDEEKLLRQAADQEEGIRDKIRRAVKRGTELEPYVRKAYRKCMECDG
jgi:5-methylthioadenosine/S-adenosylhomocysteine deaminase